MTIPRACVVGWPAKHSRSPMIHRYWLRQYDVSGDYGIEEVPPEAFPGFLSTLDERGYVGCNVTVPHKEAALRCADIASDTAKAVGAANTLWLENGRLCADNTDVEGFLASLDTAAPGWDAGSGHAVVLGAGGAARGIVWGLSQRGRRVEVVNRNQDRARALTGIGSEIHAHGWDALPDLLSGAALVANTTSLGMQGEPDLTVDLTALPVTACVADIVYVPLKTTLLKTAEQRGNPTADGLGMLLHQAVAGFARWFGVRPAVTPELRAVVAADIEGE